MNSEKIFIFMGKSAVFVLSLPNKIARLSAVHNNKVYNFNIK